MTLDEIVKFWSYEYCPRGSGGRADHERKLLRHALVAGRRVCIFVEALPPEEGRRG